MNIIRRALRKIVHKLGGRKIIPLKWTAVLLHIIELKRFPKLRNPRDLNEKIMWMAFNRDTTLWSQLSDKYEVRKYVAEKGFSNILIPIVGVYDKFEDIPQANLPSKFVIKSTDGSAQNIMVYDKDTADWNRIRDIINNWHSLKFGYATGEPHYINIPSRIIIEEMLPIKEDGLPIDYKFMCFNGKVHSCLVCSERDDQTFLSKFNLFNVKDWSEIKNGIRDINRGKAHKIQKPLFFNEMARIATILSQGFPFVRVDLYQIEKQIYFGEMTFTPAGFRISYINPSTLLEMGNIISIHTISK